MNRVSKAAKLVNSIKAIKTILEVGCRDCVLKTQLSTEIDYTGNDLFQNKNNSVSLVGDITNLEIENRSYDCVIALDVLEHVENPHELFDKLAKITKKYLIINLPNGYDLKSRIMFLNGHLSEKYVFKPTNTLDRHRWIMGYNEIIQFYQYKAIENKFDLEIININYGESQISFSSIFGIILRVLPNTLSTESVLGFFKKH